MSNNMTENITVNEQNSVKIESSIGVIYVDPVNIRDENKDAAFIFITHDHYDHFSPDDIMKIATKDTILVVPDKMKDKAEKVAGIVGKIETVVPGEKKEIGGLNYETVPSYNILKPFHPKSAGWVGYIFDVDGKRIYDAGDTDATKEAEQVKCDIALIPVGGTYTMDAKKAAEFVNKICPSVAIPVHYGMFVGSPKDGDEFAKHVDDKIKVEFKIEF